MWQRKKKIHAASWVLGWLGGVACPLCVYSHPNHRRLTVSARSKMLSEEEEKEEREQQEEEAKPKEDLEHEEVENQTEAAV